MLRLHDYLPSQNGYKIRMLLIELELAWQSVPVAIFQGEARTPAFLGKNPAGAVPVLEIESGETIAESSAILWYLAERGGFLPSTPLGRAKTLQWLSFEQYYVEPTIGSLRYWTLTGRLSQNAVMAEAKPEAGIRALAALERHLGGHTFLIEEGYGIADIALFAYTHLADDGGFELGSYPAVSAWIERVRSRARQLPPVHPYTPDAAVAPSRRAMGGAEPQHPM